MEKISFLCWLCARAGDLERCRNVSPRRDQLCFLVVMRSAWCFMVCFQHGEGEVFSSSDVAAVRDYTSTLSPGPRFLVRNQPIVPSCGRSSVTCLSLRGSSAVVKQNYLGA